MAVTSPSAGDKATATWAQSVYNALGSGEPVQAGGFIIYYSGSTIKARNCLTGMTTSGTDATAIIQAALNALTYGGTLFFQTATSSYARTIFNCDKLVIPDVAKGYGIRFCGDTQRMPTITHTGTNESLLTMETPANDYYYVILENMRFTSGATTGAYPIIDFNGVYQSLIHNCQIQGQTDQSNDGIKYGSSNPGHYNKVSDSYLWRLNTAIDIDQGFNADRLFFTHVYDVNTAFDIDGGSTQLIMCSAEQIDEYAIKLGAHATYPLIIGARLENTVSEGTAFHLTAGCTGAKILGSSQYSFATPLSDAGTNTVIRWTEGLITENEGTATIPDDSTSIAVTHGLGYTPTLQDITVTPTNNLGDATKFWIADPTSTDFDIHIDADPGATTATFVWQISKKVAI